MPDRQSWNRTWATLGVPPAEGAFDQLIERYAEPHRAYHTMQHIDECFAVLEPVLSSAQHPTEIELALWFHDAVYDPRASDNEERSARLAGNVMRNAGVDDAVTIRVESLILTTKHNQLPQKFDNATNKDAALLVDADLAILGASPDRFDEYDRQIRLEYAWVADAEYRIGRARVLNSFLSRQVIYRTASFADRFESKARENLSRAIANLSQ